MRVGNLKDAGDAGQQKTYVERGTHTEHRREHDRPVGVSMNGHGDQHPFKDEESAQKSKIENLRRRSQRAYFVHVFSVTKSLENCGDGNSCNKVRCRADLGSVPKEGGSSVHEEDVSGSDSGERSEQDLTSGDVKKKFGVPYNFEQPSVERAKSRMFNSDDHRLFPPKSFGAGWTVNFY